MATNHHLFDLAKSGDKQAEQELLAYLLERFRVFATHKMRNREAIEEVVQDSCLTVLRKYKYETFTVGFEPWAWGVLRTNIKNYFYRQSIERQRIVNEASIGEPFSGNTDINGELERRLLVCLKHVVKKNSQYGRVLNLAYQGYTTHEICDKLGQTRNNVYVVLHRARTMLKACLDGNKE